MLKRLGQWRTKRRQVQEQAKLTEAFRRVCLEGTIPRLCEPTFYARESDEPRLTQVNAATASQLIGYLRKLQKEAPHSISAFTNVLNKDQPFVNDGTVVNLQGNPYQPTTAQQEAAKPVSRHQELYNSDNYQLARRAIYNLQKIKVGEEIPALPFLDQAQKQAIFGSSGRLVPEVRAILDDVGCKISITPLYRDEDGFSYEETSFYFSHYDQIFKDRAAQLDAPYILEVDKEAGHYYLLPKAARP